MDVIMQIIEKHTRPEDRCRIAEWKELANENWALFCEQLAQSKSDMLNAKAGGLEGLDCPVCKNKGFIHKAVKGVVDSIECECMSERRVLNVLKKSGLAGLIGMYTFDRYKTERPWQQQIKDSAMRFAENPEGWFFIGGQTGCGKTHICTAIFGSLIKACNTAYYMPWREDSVRLKSLINDDTAYEAKINTVKNAQLLYIDDLWKPSSREYPSDADVRLAYEIINYRYNNLGSITLISGEWGINELRRIDGATGGRILERAAEHKISVTPDESKDMRGLLPC